MDEDRREHRRQDFHPAGHGGAVLTAAHGGFDPCHRFFPTLRRGDRLDTEVHDDGGIAFEQGDVEQDAGPPAGAMDAFLDEHRARRRLHLAPADRGRRQQPAQTGSPRRDQGCQHAGDQRIENEPGETKSPGRPQEERQDGERGGERGQQIGVEVIAGA
ncbi:MAG TPA: hypothetical protein VGK45_02745, partial [Thermoanaerobaculia bacterium]